MFITVITDCTGENDRARQATRYASLFGITPTIIGVSPDLGLNATLEAAGNLVDTLDAADDAKGVIVVNVAPRGDKKDGTNGTHFSYFKYRNVLVISTIKGYCLSLVKKLDLVKKVNILDTEEVLEFAEKEGLIGKGLKKYITNSQFRSFDFVPRVAKWLTDGVGIPSKRIPLTTDNKLSSCIWLIDSFGNAKTTLLAKELNKGHPELISGSKNHMILKQVQNDKFLKTNLGKFKFYNRLKDLPSRETALYIGSSGIGNKRFVEIATQAVSGSAAKTLNLKIGDKIILL